jgi:ankyrin repeat protein
MHFASRNGLVNIVKVLIQHKADVNCVTKDGVTSLLLACDHEHKHVVEVLLKNDATVNQADKDGITPLHIAVQTNLKDIEELLLEYKAI